jgi:hypothetical protein
MADYLVLFDAVSGVIDVLWPAGTANNASTWEADGHIEIDGVIVAGIESGGFTPAVAILTDPTFADPAASAGVAEVDSVSSPSDAVTRTDSERFPDYPYEL